ncbi:Eukaryotic-type carbonic anhydrase family protein [Aphelenchoides avenae]|nr:Eukaryotic-type carbonic anhydrase family protein [Aphelenchus avenae]
MRYIVFAVLLGVAAAKLQLSAPGAWSYDAQDQWPGVCQTGKRQSPIGLRSDDADRVNVTELRFHHYDTTGQFYVVSNGKGARVHGFDSWKQGPYIDGGGLHGSYALDEIHFVWKRTDSGVRFEAASEHSINGYPYPVEWKRFTEMEMPTWTPNQRHQQDLNGRLVILRDPTSTKTDPGRPAGGRDPNATMPGIAACSAFWPLVAAIVVLLIVGVQLPDGIFF